MRKRKKSNIGVLSIALFAVMMLWFIISAGNAGKAVDDQGAQAVYSQIMNGASMCYSIEGAYPQSIAYLEENYGVIYDKDKYAVDYRFFGANIRPTVTVVIKEKS